jgi:hypothetical protein
VLHAEPSLFWIGPVWQQEETMNLRTFTALGGRSVVAAFSLTAILVASGGPVMGQSASSASPRGLAGTWAIQVTPRSCATGAALPSFNSLVTFHQGGTLSESAGSLAFAAGQRSPGHGIWARQRNNTYLQKMVALILFDSPPNLPSSPGFSAGWQTVTHTVVPSDADHFTSSGTNEFYNSNGVVYRSGCSTAVGERFE